MGVGSFISGLLGDIGGLAGDRSQNEFRDINRENFDLPGYQEQQDRLGRGLDMINKRQTPQIGQYERAGASDFRGQQQGLAGLLMDRARGQGLVSSEMLRQGADAGLAQQQAMAQSGRGNPALAARTAMQNAGRITQGLAGQQALAGAQEAQMAAMGLGGLLGQARSMDEALAMFNAGQTNQRALEQARLAQQQYAINDAARQGLLGTSLQAAGMQQQGGMGYEQQRGQRFAGMLGVPTAQEKGIGAFTGLAGLFGLG